MAMQAVKVPDIGNYKNIPVIELLVKPGESVIKDQALVTLESDKATMEVPAPFAGVITELKVKLGDEVSEGTVVALLDAADATTTPTTTSTASSSITALPSASVAPVTNARLAAPATAVAASTVQVAAEVANHSIDAEIAGPRTPPISFDATGVMPDKVAYASPAVRLFARELGVDLDKVSGSGRKNRITREDVQAFVKQMLAHPVPMTSAAMRGDGWLNLLPWPQVDFSKFGDIEQKPLSRIKKISGANLARNWVMIPHVTQFDNADITDLEALRVTLNKENEKSGTKLTMLAFLIKACVAALKKYPDFNSSLDASGENLVLKKYFHIGFAADTPNGLVVPVLKDVDKKGVLEIAKESSVLAAKARDGKLGPADMQGGCMSISSLGGIGGTAFTPIVNAPEVAILGVSKAAIKPVWNGKEFAPRMILPLSLSYDHRVIDGASAARFTAYLGQLLADMRRGLL